MIRIDNLRVVRDTTLCCAVERFVVSADERAVVTGPNGAGKTTLLRLLAVQHDGICDVAIPARQRTYVHQSPYMLRGTVENNLTFGLRGRNMSRRQRTQVALEWAEQLGIESLLERDARSLSGGEQRRVAIGRALAVQPRLLLLDEPFADLDQHSRPAVERALEKLESTTVVIASPLLDDETTGWRQLDLSR